MLLVVAVASLYLPALGAEFVWDDLGLVKPSPALRDLKGLRDAVSTDLYRQADASLRASSYWRPLAMVSFWLDTRMGEPPRSLHAGNIVLHVIATVLLFLVLLRRPGDGRVFASTLVAAWWALHPEQVEAVSWISCRYELLSAVALLGLLTLPWRPGTANAIAHGLLFLAGLLSKDAFLPVALVLAADDWAERRSRRSIAPRWAAFGAAVGIWAVARVLLAIPAPELPSPSSLAADVLGSASVYAWRAIHPLPLTTAHPYASGDRTMLVAGAAILVALALAAARNRRFAVPGAVFVAGILPAALALRSFGVAPERYFYIPSIGLALLLREGLREIEASPQAIRVASLAAVAASCLVGLFPAVARVREWRTGSTLFAATLRVDPQDPQANLVLANEAGLAGRWEDARVMLERAQERDPDSARVANALARIHLERHDARGAVAQAERATTLEPDRPQAWLYLAWAHHLAGEHARELKALDRALQLSPGYAEARIAREKAEGELAGGLTREVQSTGP
jgi:hypothetical protein